jgi:hypothetical protein
VQHTDAFANPSGHDVRATITALVGTSIAPADWLAGLVSSADFFPHATGDVSSTATAIAAWIRDVMRGSSRAIRSFYFGKMLLPSDKTAAKHSSRLLRQQIATSP